MSKKTRGTIATYWKLSQLAYIKRLVEGKFPMIAISISADLRDILIDKLDKEGKVATRANVAFSNSFKLNQKVVMEKARNILMERDEASKIIAKGRVNTKRLGLGKNFGVAKGVQI